MRAFLCFSLLLGVLVLAALTSTERSTFAQQKPEVVPQCATTPSGMVSWWRAEINGFDMRRGHNGKVKCEADSQVKVAGALRHPV